MSLEYFTLNESLILRKDDESVFNADKFKIYKFNKNGYIILSQFFDKKIQLTDVSNIENMNNEDVQNFLKKCIENNILIPATK